MTIIVTMAGMGMRFRDAGYDCPKYMIETKGKTLFEWSMAKCFIDEKCTLYGIKCFKVVEIDRLTDGQATTCMLAIPYCDPDKPVMIYNIDTYVEPYNLRYSDIEGDGFIPCFYAEGNHWSFVSTGADGQADEVREKERISDNCSVGAYYFSSAKLYKEIYEDFYAGGTNVEKKEKYIAPMYNHMIKKGLAVRISLLNAACVHVLGTPEEVKEFEALER